MIYLDSAATTLEKPESVRRAMIQAVNHMSSPGRGSYQATRLAEETDFLCRSEAAALFDVGDPSQVVFTMNATHGLNIAIHSLVPSGGKVIISGYEHNAVTRPLHAIPNMHLTILDTPPYQPMRMVEELEKALRQGADAVICNHVSNVFGCVQPIEEMADLCRRAGVPLVIDASQSAGVIPVSLEKLGAAFIAMPGHKGLYGPQGTGLLLCNHASTPLLYGGTGSLSRLQSMPEDLPDRLEAGTHNMPGIAGLLEGIRFVRRTGVEKIASHERQLAARAVEQLRKIDGVHVFYDSGFTNQTGVVSFIAEGYDCETIGEAMAQKGVALRAGLHCAPLAHRTVGTLKTGTIRLSPSYFNRREQIDKCAEILAAVLREKVTF